MSLDQPTSCWREVLLSSLMSGAEDLSTVSQKYNLKKTMHVDDFYFYPRSYSPANTREV